MAIQDEVARLRRENRNLKKYLTKLSDVCVVVIEGIDRLYSPEVWRKLPEVQKGQIMAEIRNKLEMSNDIARHFGLGYSFKKDAKLKEKVIEKADGRGKTK